MLDKPSKRSPLDADRHVGLRIRQRRSSLGMSQDALGARIGVTFQQIQKYEKGSNRVGAGRLLDLAQALEVPVAFFFEGIGEAQEASLPAVDPLHAYGATREGIDVLRVFSSIADPSSRRKLLNVARIVAGMAAEEAA